MSAVLDKNKAHYRKIFLVQFVLIVVGYTLINLSQPALSLSLLLGALIGWLPQLAFAVYVFYLRANVPLQDKLKIFYQGEGIKIALTVILLLLVFVNITIDPLLFFAGYFGLILLNNLLPFILTKSKN
ncbi:hypothetical protein OA57_00105 [Chelonobacter oris]|uniref:B30.2/SPRY domain-containing protein n=1 Tax=Chelonobacter oris TaxID=505317 RepID=A0A0A3AUR5_9PAST|nr:ATP synthase subunit I [Chelonobacter oris]KGQ71512.1 hypothetical protein OA57_00105 [Chelonobacter oris]